jgi:hypothetical protein
MFSSPRKHFLHGEENISFHGEENISFHGEENISCMVKNTFPFMVKNRKYALHHARNVVFIVQKMFPSPC